MNAMYTFDSKCIHCMANEPKTHNFNIRGISKALKSRVKVAAAKKGNSTEAELRELITRTYPPEKK